MAHFAPPFPEKDWYPPRAWPLLQAMHASPVLRLLYPAQPLNGFALVPASAGDWWQAPDSSLALWPSVVCLRQGAYEVWSRVYPVEETDRLLVTWDPAEAVARLEELVTVRRLV